MKTHIWEHNQIQTALCMHKKISSWQSCKLQLTLTSDLRDTERASIQFGHCSIAGPVITAVQWKTCFPKPFRKSEGGMNYSFMDEKMTSILGKKKTFSNSLDDKTENREPRFSWIVHINHTCFFSGQLHLDIHVCIWFINEPIHFILAL